MNPKKPMTARSKILIDAVRQSHEIKDQLYGDPQLNLACAGELKRVFLKYAARSLRRIGPAEHEAVDQALSKIARIATSPKPIEGSYTSAAGYLAIAGELGCHSNGKTPPPVDRYEAAEEEAENAEVEISEEELAIKLEQAGETLNQAMKPR